MKVIFSNKAKTAIAGLVLTSVMATSHIATALVVYDPAAVAQAVKQVHNQVQQIKTMQDQLRATTGNAHLGVLLNDPNVQKSLARYTPKGVSLSDLTSGNYDQVLQRVAKRIEQDMANQKTKDPKVQLAQATLLNYAQVEQSLTDLTTLSRSAQTIAKQINSTTDASSKADLANTLMAQSNQINLAIAQINLKMRQMEMLEKQSEKVFMDNIRKKQNR